MKKEKKSRMLRSEVLLLLAYFLGLIAAGTGLLYLPFSWGGGGSLSFIDALFTATSAVCVTGLITVDTARYTLFGQIVILLLIQFGGLGIISFATIYITRAKSRLSLIRQRTIKGFFLESVEAKPVDIIRTIVLMTLGFEAVGAVLLFPAFRETVEKRSIFTSIFHSISAFCNAGFSTFSNNLEGYTTNLNVNATVMILIVLGGLGFVVLQDSARRISGRKRRIHLHTRIVLLMSLVLIAGSTILYFLFELEGAYRGLKGPQKVMAALFQAVTPRTAGFDTVSQASLSMPSKVLTLLLMFIGGSSGSIAGGIKTNTFFIILLMSLQRPDEAGGVVVFNRRIGSDTMYRAMVFFIKALGLLFLGTFLLTLTEHWLAASGSKNFIDLCFETFSAFGTVGLSLGITPRLTAAGKLVVVAVMFFGRVGLLALAIPRTRRIPPQLLDYPHGEVMIG